MLSMESKLERARKQEQRDFIVSRSDNEMPLWQRMAGCGFLSFTATFLGMSKRNQSMNACKTMKCILSLISLIL